MEIVVVWQIVSIDRVWWLCVLREMQQRNLSAMRKQGPCCHCGVQGKSNTLNENLQILIIDAFYYINYHLISLINLYGILKWLINFDITVKLSYGGLLR